MPPQTPKMRRLVDEVGEDEEAWRSAASFPSPDGDAGLAARSLEPDWDRSPRFFLPKCMLGSARGGFAGIGRGPVGHGLRGVKSLPSQIVVIPRLTRRMFSILQA